MTCLCSNVWMFATCGAGLKLHFYLEIWHFPSIFDPFGHFLKFCTPRQQACAENTKKSDNYGIICSRLERNYTLHMKISLERILPYHVGKQCWGTYLNAWEHKNLYNYMKLHSFKWNNCVPIPTFWMFQNIFIRICRHLNINHISCVIAM